jgi:hypothetical protein
MGTREKKNCEKGEKNEIFSPRVLVFMQVAIYKIITRNI